MSREIGWIGLGRMGEAMVGRLTQAGHSVAVWNRTAPRRSRWSRSAPPRRAQAGPGVACDLVFTMISTTDDLKQVLFAEDGLVAGARSRRSWSTAPPSRRRARPRSATRLQAMGVAYLCAPVSGNAKVAKAGKLLIVASGPRELYEQAEPYLQAMSRKVMWVGEGELARIWKIAHNTMFGVIIQNLCEITVLAEKAGIPRHVFLASINDSVLGSMYTRYKTPVLANLNFEQVTFTPKLLLKDMDLGLAAARTHGVAMPAAAATRESVARMVGRGHEEVDFAVLLLETARDAGLELVSEQVRVDDGLASSVDSGLES